MKNRTLYFLGVLLLTSCSEKLNTSRSAEDFEQFYDRFHTDRSFQLERVKFPLEGTYEDADGEIIWNRSNWMMHQQKVTEITEPNYDTEIIQKDQLVIDKVNLRGSGYNSERHFRLIDGKWYLVYYDSSNL